MSPNKVLVLPNNNNDRVLSAQNLNKLTPNRAKRNLNETFDVTHNAPNTPPILNYSIVQQENLKVKFKLNQEPKILMENLDDKKIDLIKSKLLNRRVSFDCYESIKQVPQTYETICEETQYTPQKIRRSSRTVDRISYVDYSPMRRGLTIDSDKSIKHTPSKIKTPRKSINNRVSTPKRVIKAKTPKKTPIVVDKEVIVIDVEQIDKSPICRPTRSKSTDSNELNLIPLKTPTKRVSNKTKCNYALESNQAVLQSDNTSQKKLIVDEIAVVDDEEIEKNPSPICRRTRSKSTDSIESNLIPLKTPTKHVSNKPKCNYDLELNEAVLKSDNTPQKKLIVDELIVVHEINEKIVSPNNCRTRSKSTDKIEINITPLKTPTKRLRKQSVDEQLFISETTRAKRVSIKPKRYNDMEMHEAVFKSLIKSVDKAIKNKNVNVSPKKRVAQFIEEPKTPKRKVIEAVVAKTPKTPKNVASVEQLMKTPSNRIKLIRQGVITPSVQAREICVAKDNTPLKKARTKLHVSYVPKALPCREEEFADILGFVEGKLLDGCGGCMYVSGVPGTGKTATVTEVIKSLEEMVQNKDVPKFEYVSINGMRLTEPRQSYVEILRQLTGKTVAWEQAQTMLENKFTKKSAGKKPLPVVLLVDELDILCTKRQDVVYNLLDWPTKASAQLIVITIANTMDLPERLLMGKVTSRLGLTRLTFQAYTHKQLQEIVTKRLTGTNAFNPDAIQLVARKVASVSGDARRALDICRRAAEVAELEGPKTLVSMGHVNEALNAMITQPKVRAIRHCSRLEQLLLQAVVAEVERTGVEETTFADVLVMLVSVAALDGFPMVSCTLALAATSRLGACRLLLTEHKSIEINQRIILNVSPDDIHYALRKD